MPKMTKAQAEKLLDTAAEDAALDAMLDHVDRLIDQSQAHLDSLQERIARGYQAAHDVPQREESASTSLLRRATIPIGIMGLLFCSTALSNSAAETLDAINQVEASGKDHAPRGDNGSAVGPLQVHLAAFSDSGVPGKWEDCEDLAFSRRVALAYWSRYCPDALRSGDSETMARIWQGGPRGAHHACTLAYWELVKSHLTEKPK